MKICFLAPSGYGKSTAVKLLSENHVLANIKIAEPLYELQKKFYDYIGIDIEGKQDGELLQYFGEKIRKENKYFLLDNFKQRMQVAERDYSVILNDDCRPADYAFLKDLGFVFVRINGMKRMRDDHRKSNSMNKLEWQNDIPFDYMVDNYGTIEEYRENLEKLIELISSKIDKCYVIPSFACDSDCITCISKTRDFSSMPVNLNPANMDYSLNLLKRRGIRKFEITGGGDPLMNSQLLYVVRRIKKIIPNAFIKLYTNGNDVSRINTDFMFCVDEIDLSIISDDDNINQQFMRNNNPESFLEKLRYWRRLLDVTTTNAFQKKKLRLSIAVMKGAIDSPEKLQALIDKSKDFVDEYVVRTLYKGTPDLKELYVNFEFKHPLVKWERNNTSNKPQIVMSTDGKLYEDFELSRRNYMMSYILLKPDAMTHFGDIIAMTKERGFNIKAAYLVDKFYDSAQKLYYLKHQDYTELVKKHLELTQDLFGNRGVLLVLDKDEPVEILMSDTLALKKEIRRNFSLTQRIGGTISIKDGHYQLNTVHCPDTNIKYFDKDLDILSEASLKPLKDIDINTMIENQTFQIYTKESKWQKNILVQNFE